MVELVVQPLLAMVKSEESLLWVVLGTMVWVSDTRKTNLRNLLILVRRTQFLNVQLHDSFSRAVRSNMKLSMIHSPWIRLSGSPPHLSGVLFRRPNRPSF